MAATDRPLRADAARNRGRIPDAARAQISTHGPDVGMARSPQRPESRSERSTVTTRRSPPSSTRSLRTTPRKPHGASASAEVIAFLGDLIERAAQNRIVKAAAAKESSGEVSRDELRAKAALAGLITSAQDEGGIAAGVTVEDFYLLFASAPTDRPAADRQRWLELVVPGLLPQSLQRGGSPENG